MPDCEIRPDKKCLYSETDVIGPCGDCAFALVCLSRRIGELDRENKLPETRVIRKKGKQVLEARFLVPMVVIGSQHRLAHWKTLLKIEGGRLWEDAENC